MSEELPGQPLSELSRPELYAKIRELQHTVMALSTRSTPGTGSVETAWLIELKGAAPAWWSLHEDEEPGWETDSLKALRFARKADADAYIRDAGWTEAFASEHEWSDPKPHEWWEWHGLTCFKNCGIVRRTDGGNDRARCRGKVSIGLRLSRRHDAR